VKKTDSPNDSEAGWLLVFAACIVAVTATLGSLFFSEVMSVPVCELCWYQRIALYPLVIVLAMGLFPFNPSVVRTAGVLVVLGWLIAIFQVLLVARCPALCTGNSLLRNPYFIARFPEYSGALPVNLYRDRHFAVFNP
jgi:disulfide bond formation protein DsbB